MNPNPKKHLYWTGPRSKDQKPVVKWLPSIPVNVSDYDGLPAVIHKVDKKKEE